MNLQQTKILRTISKIVLVLTGLFILGYVGYVVYMGIKFKPYKVRVTNVTDSAFTVSWVTDNPMPGIVYYGEKDNFLPGPLAWIGKKRAVDDRDSSDAMSECVSKFNKKVLKTRDVNFTVDASGFDCSNVRVWKYGRYYTHHITVQNLDAEKEYFFRVGDGIISYGKNSGTYQEGEIAGVSEFKSKTFALFNDFTKPIPAYGTVETAYLHEDGYYLLQKDFDSIVFLVVKAVGTSPVIFSSVSNSDGGWSMDLSNSRMEDGSIIDITSATMNFTPQSQNHWTAKSREYKYEDLTFPLNLAANQEEDTQQKEITEIFDRFIKAGEASSAPGRTKGGSSRTTTNNSSSGNKSSTNNSSSGNKSSTNNSSSGNKTSTTDTSSSATRVDTTCRRTGEKGPLTFCGDCYYRTAPGGNPSAPTCGWEHNPGDYSCYDHVARCGGGDSGDKNEEDQNNGSGDKNNSSGDKNNDSGSKSNSSRDKNQESNNNPTVCYEFNGSVRECRAKAYTYTPSSCLSEAECKAKFVPAEPEKNCFIKYPPFFNKCYPNSCNAWGLGLKFADLTHCENTNPLLIDYFKGWSLNSTEVPKEDEEGSVCCIAQGATTGTLKKISECDSSKGMTPTGEAECKVLGSPVSDPNRVAKPITRNNVFADGSQNSNSNTVLYLPDKGVYKLNFGKLGDAHLLNEGNVNKYYFYEERNNIDGFQEAVDLSNPLENEDRIIQHTGVLVNYSREAIVREIDLKEGINIISFNMIPSTGGESMSLNTDDFFDTVNASGDNVSKISSFSAGKWDSGVTYDFTTKSAKGGSFEIVFGKGYVVVAERDVTISIPGFELITPIPVAFSTGWNLVGVHGYSTAYTARTFIESINTTEGLKANHVAWWPTSRGMYQGYQLTNGQSFGQDFPISPLNGYLVRINEFNPPTDTCKSINWQPGGDSNGKCN